MTRLRTHILLSLVTAAGLAGCRKAADPEAAQEVRNQTAAALVQRQDAQPLDLPGCPNLYKISDTLYRGAQPDAAGFAELKKLGIKTVLNLRDAHSDRQMLEGTGLDYVEIDMEAWDPEYDEVKAALQIVKDPARQPVFVHCRHGADRTGTIVASYRVVIDGWTKEEAITEMTEGPFGFHELWIMLPRFIRRLDVEQMQKDLNIQPALASGRP